MDLDLKGKKALVTGGSRGIGRGIVLALARQGVSVAACYQKESEAVTSLAEELKKLGNDSHVVKADVSDEADVARLMEDVKSRFGRVDVLVNNAGVISHIPLADMPLSEWRRIIDTNLTSMYLVTKGALELLHEGASIINVTSAVAMVGMAGGTHYTASKTGVIGFTRSLCKELGKKGIRVNGIAPGIIDTDQAARLSPDQRIKYANLASLGRLGDSEAVSNVALFLASDLSRFVSGVTMNVDGGI